MTAVVTKFRFCLTDGLDAEKERAVLGGALHKKARFKEAGSIS